MSYHSCYPPPFVRFRQSSVSCAILSCWFFAQYFFPGPHELILPRKYAVLRCSVRVCVARHSIHLWHSVIASKLTGLLQHTARALLGLPLATFLFATVSRVCKEGSVCVLASITVQLCFTHSQCCTHVSHSFVHIDLFNPHVVMHGCVTLSLMMLGRQQSWCTMPACSHVFSLARCAPLYNRTCMRMLTLSLAPARSQVSL